MRKRNFQALITLSKKKNSFEQKKKREREIFIYSRRRGNENLLYFFRISSLFIAKCAI